MVPMLVLFANHLGSGLEEAERDLAAGPLVWSDGSLVLDNVSGFGVLELVSTHMRLAYSDLLPPLPDGGG